MVMVDEGVRQRGMGVLDLLARSTCDRLFTHVLNILEALTHARRQLHDLRFEPLLALITRQGFGRGRGLVICGNPRRD